MKRRTTLICLLLCLLWACFILGNSMLPGSQSSNLSRTVLNWIHSIFPFLNFLNQHMLRKMAHFTEFAILGALAGLLFRQLGETKLHAASSPLLLGLITAAIDETIQIYVPNRGSSLIDVWIDTAGVVTGSLAILLLLKLISARSRKK